MGIDVIVCMKQVPDTQKVRIDPDRGTLIRKGVPSITNPFDESALELALGIREKMGGTVTVLTMGIPDAACILRDAMTLGADRAILVTGRDLAGADTLATSYALSRAIEFAGRVSSAGLFDLLLFGKQAIDGDTAQVGPEVAGTLGIPVITFVTDVRKITAGGIVVERAADGCREVVSTGFPSILTVVRAEKRLRMPTIEGIVSSFSAEVETAGPEEIGAVLDHCGLKGSPTRVKKIFSPSSGGRVTFLEGSTEEKACGFVEVMKEKGFM